jgi:hypothetical protein
MAALIHLPSIREEGSGWMSMVAASAFIAAASQVGSSGATPGHGHLAA